MGRIRVVFEILQRADVLAHDQEYGIAQPVQSVMGISYSYYPCLDDESDAVSPV